MKTFSPILLAVLVSTLSQTEVPALSPNPAPAVELRGLAEAPLYFEAQSGATAASARFVAHGKDCTVILTPTEATVLVAAAEQTRTVRLTLVGANTGAEMSGLGELPGRANYFIGTDPTQWRVGESLFTRVRLAQVYPGIDVVYYADQSARLEHDFLVSPGANPGQISLRISGADQVSVTATGELVLKMGGSEIRQHAPVIYQTINGVRKTIVGGYRLANKTTARFWIGDYDHSQPLVIDPIITVSFASYLAGKNGDHGWDIATDVNGNVYVCGDTLTPSLVATNASVIQPTYRGTQGSRQSGDAFVAKFAPNGSNILSLAYLTYLGGKGQDTARAIATDSDGNAYVTGFTDSTNFPTSHPAYRKISGRNNTASGIYRSDAFVAKLDAQGATLVYSTYLGGSERESGNAIAVDSMGRAYVAGFTESADFPIVTNSVATHVVQPKLGGLRDAFVARLAVSGTNLDYSTYLGGSGQESAQGVAVDAAGNAYLTGYTASFNYPVVPKTNAFLNGHNVVTAAYDAFLTRISANGATNDFSTYLGGDSTEVGLRVAVDSTNSVYLTGYTYSTNFPVTGTVANTHIGNIPLGGYSDVFLTKLSPQWLTGFTNQIIATNLTFITNQMFFTNLVYAKNYSVQFGGSRADQALGLAVNAAGEACLSGFTTGTNIFGTNILWGAGNLYDLRSTNRSNGTNREIFVVQLNATATAFQFGALLGGSGTDNATGVALDLAGNAYLVGGTTSTNFPTVHSIEARPGGNQTISDVIVAKIFLGGIVPTRRNQTRLGTAPTTIRVANSPSLVIEPVADEQVTLSWPAYQPEYSLEARTDLSTGSWQPVLIAPAVDEGVLKVTLPAANSGGYFRLIAP